MLSLRSIPHYLSLHYLNMHQKCCRKTPSFFAYLTTFRTFVTLALPAGKFIPSGRKDRAQMTRFVANTKAKQIMADNTAISLETIIAETQKMIAEGKVGPAAEYAFEVFENIVEDYRENRSTDKPSMKKAAEAFEPTNELEEAAADILAEIRQIVFREISQSPELSVLLYSGLKDYAQDHVKEYRDAVLRGVLGELDSDEEDTDYVLPLSREELLSLKTHVESLAKLADTFGQSADLPVREKTGNIKFANTKGYGEDAAVASDVDVTKFTYSLDGEEIPATTLADVALWHVSSANEVFTPSDIMRLVREQHGNKARSEGWKIEVNGQILEAKPVSN